MSQAGQINSAAGPVPPAVPTSFVTDVNSPSIPIANIENVLGGTTTTNNNNGIQTDGSSGSNTLTIQLTNRIFGTTTTSDGAGQSQVVASLNLGATPGTFVLNVIVAAYNTTDGTGAGYTTQASVRTNGVTGTGISQSSAQVQEEGVFTDTEVQYGFAGNVLQVQVTGVAAKTIDWKAVGTYVFVS